MQTAAKLSRYRWVILAVAWASYTSVYLSRLIIGPLGPSLKAAFNLSNTQVGSLASAAGILYAPSIAGAGWLVDRFGVRKVLTAGTFFTSLFIMSVFFAPSYEVMLIILVLSGLATGCIFPSAVKAIILWFPLRERSTALGVNQTGINVGGIVGAAILPTIAVAFGWKYAFLFTGLTMMVICLICALLYRNPREHESPTVKTATDKPTTTQTTLALFKSRDLWILGFGGFFLCITEFAAMAHLVLYLTESWLFAAAAAGGLLALTQAAGALGKPGSGLLSDRLLKGRRKMIYFSMAATSAIICLLFALFGKGMGWLLYPVILVFGISAIGWGGIATALVVELSGKETAGASTGMTSAFMVLGAIIGPPLYGYIVDRTNSFELAWLALGISSVVSAIFISLIREQRKRI